MKILKYSINLAWSEEDESYVATSPELPGLSAFGDTPEEAAGEARIVAKDFVEVYEEEGWPVPQPKLLKSFSGQTRLRMPKSLHTALSREAEQEGVSLNSYLVHLLSERHIENNIHRRLDKLAQSANEKSKHTININAESPPDKTPETESDLAPQMFQNFEVGSSVIN